MGGLQNSGSTGGSKTTRETDTRIAYEKPETPLQCGWKSDERPRKWLVSRRSAVRGRWRAAVRGGELSQMRESWKGACGESSGRQTSLHYGVSDR